MNRHVNDASRKSVFGRFSLLRRPSSWAWRETSRDSAFSYGLEKSLMEYIPVAVWAVYQGVF